MTTVNVATCILDTLSFKQESWKMSKGKAAQEKRLKADDQRKNDEKYVADDRRDTYRACWNEALEEASETRRHMYQLMDIKKEVLLGNETLIKVRRAQLRHLVKLEDEQYKDELNSLGLTIYKDRK